MSDWNREPADSDMKLLKFGVDSVSKVFLLFLLLSVSSSDTVLRDDVDLVEVNHYHDERGRPVFDQLIFYDWSEQRKRFHVRGWRLIKSDRQLPRRSYYADTYRIMWHDDGVLREVTAKSMRETWTQHDPELVEREYLPQDQRRDLKSITVAN